MRGEVWERVETMFGEQFQRLSESWGELKATTRPLGGVRNNFLRCVARCVVPTQASPTQSQRKVRHGFALQETRVAPGLGANNENVKIRS